MPVRAAIDIGTNTVLLLVAEVNGNRIQTLLERQEIPRLGKHVDEARNLSPDGMEMVINVLDKYIRIIHGEFGDIPVIVTATSAVRDAANRDFFLHQIRAATRLEVRILSGEEEAAWTFTGAIAPMNFSSDQQITVVDIGGGSTELAVGLPNAMQHAVSIDMGSVRFTERYLKHSPPDTSDIISCKSAIVKELTDISHGNLFKTNMITGVGGTVTTLAVLCHHIKFIQDVNVLGLVITRHALTSLTGRMQKLSADQLLILNPVILKGRQDIIFAGLLILDGIMEFFGFDELTVSTGGIRHGSLLRTPIN
jgi:exopolyphosphatase / guanosine-5'-triphosphate,3'-diphosphate pyrophosphatase